ncbi:DUF6197 family protein [Kitasatospora aureofaciens]|uniref:DUF6197 family protein n=1 Tax=Kitasatospora aureofaciens TaxID=1894 RepID=UPI0034022B31
MSQKALPDIYREAADLVLKTGKTEGEMKAVSEENQRCYGFCTMGAVFEAAGGLFDEFGDLVNLDVQSPEFLRLVGPIADQIAASGRRQRVTQMYNGDEFEPADPNDSAYWTIASWNDDRRGEAPAPTAEDVAQLLREAADAVEEKGECA